MKICPKCGAELDDVIGGYLCHECGGGMFSEDEVIVATCPTCGDELGDLCDEYYCYTCSQSVRKEDAVYSKDISFDDDYDFEEPNYDSMIDNRPGDSCSDFVQSHHFASYGDEGQYQFNETRRDTANKLYHWKNNR